MMWSNGAECLGGGFPMMFGGIFMLVFWGLVIWLIVLAITKLSPGGSKSNQTDNAVNILRQRYSRGEIDTEEYRQRLHELTDTNKI